MKSLRIRMFYHSLVSDWNNGNSHFLRGIVSELVSRGHDVQVYEPRKSWSLQNLVQEHGRRPLREFAETYPGLISVAYNPKKLDLDHALDGADMVLAHEWNDPLLVKQLGAHRARQKRYRLLFHDTHHRSASDPKAMRQYDLKYYDGVLAFGEVVRKIYLKRKWARRVWTWHEAADVRVFHPPDHPAEKSGDLVWIGNWGDNERAAELQRFLLGPVKQLGLKARIYGVRYPDRAHKLLAEAGVEFAGWLPNYRAPEVFARYRVTAHVPRRPYVEALPGIPTIRVFEALACGIPLVSSPWRDSEGLFTIGQDFLMGHSAVEMRRHLRAVLHEPELARELAAHGRRTILTRHTCKHRVDELLKIYRDL